MTDTLTLPNKRLCSGFKSNKKCLAALAAVLWLGVTLITPCAFGEEPSFKNRHASHFNIEYLDDGYKIVTDGMERRLLLCPRGKPLLKGFDKTRAVEIPVRRVALNNTVNAALLRPIRALDSIAGICLGGMGMTATNFDTIQKGVASGKIIHLGNGNPVDYERLKALAPDIVFGRDWNQRLIPMLDAMKIPVAVVDYFRENHPLAQLEWVRFVAAFYDKEKEAARFFDRAEQRIAAIEARAKQASHKPKVLGGVVHMGKVHVPLADSLMARMYAMGGGEYVFKDLTPISFMAGYGTITMEAFYAGAKNADLYITESSAGHGPRTIRELTAVAKIDLDIKPVRTQKIWVTQPWYWESMDHMDEIVEDIAAIIHPELFPDHRLGFFTPMPAE